MTPETGLFLDKAHRLITEAAGMLSMQYNEAAGRTAYLAGYHAAQALISDRTGRVAKTHKGVRIEFHQLIRGDSQFDEAMRAFLGTACNLKAIADYETGPGSEVSTERAVQALEEGKQFIALIEKVLGAKPQQVGR